MSAPAPLFPHLVTVSGQDGPGIAERLFGALRARSVRVEDVEQVRVHGRLLLCVEAALAAGDAGALCDALAADLEGAGVGVSVGPLVESEAAGTGAAGETTGPREFQIVTVLAPEVDAAIL